MFDVIGRLMHPVLLTLQGSSRRAALILRVKVFANPIHEHCSHNNNINNNSNVHLSLAHQRPERSHDTYQRKYDILYTCRAQSYKNNLHNVLY